jgi:hypothetical protein
MHTPKFSTKRVLGLAMAVALAVSGVVAVAGSSEAATPSASLTPATGAAAGGTVISVKGKGFADTAGTVAVLSVTFSSAVCTTTVAGTAATSYNVISATKAVVTSPALAAGVWYMCLNDAAAGATAVLGQGKFVTDAAPTASTLAPATANVAKASVLGGTTLSVAGANFTKASKATIDGLTAKTTYISSTKLSVVLPAHAVATLLPVKVTTEYGAASTTDTVSYVAVVSVSPTFGDGTANNVITLTGLGFSGYTFATSATGDEVVTFIPAGTTLTAGTTTIASLNPCTSVQVESDTSLSCKAPALSGAYSVVIVTRHGTATTWGSSATTVSKSATYTAAAF